MLFRGLVFGAIVFFNIHAHAEKQCLHFFQKNEALQRIEELLVFPPDLHLKPEAVRYLLGTSHAPLLRQLAKIFSLNDPLLKTYLPYSLKHSTNFTAAELLPIPTSPVAWTFQTHTPEFQRAYTAIKNLDSDALTENPSRPALEAETLLLMARLTEGLVPTVFPATTYKTSYDKMGEQLFQTLSQALMNKRYRDTWKVLIEHRIHFMQITSRLNNSTLPEKYYSLETFDQILARLERNNTLSKQEVVALHLLTYKMFDSLYERLQKVETVIFTTREPIEIQRDDFLALLMKDISMLVPDEHVFPAMEMFDLLFFKTPPPISEAALQQHMIEVAKTLLFPAKSEFAKWQNEQSLKAKSPVSAAIFQFTPRAESTPSIPQVAKVHIKTRGKADPAKTEALPHVAETQPVVADISLSKDLVADQVYQIMFKRAPTGLGSSTQSFVFKEDVVTWLEKNPGIGEQFLRSIQMGPTTNNAGQAGIKLLQQMPKTVPGRLYEVKIRGKYRMILSLHDGVWTALAVINKDHFDAQIRNW